MRNRLPIGLFLALGLAGCTGGEGGLPKPGSKEYVEAVSQFYVGTIALQTSDKKHDFKALQRAAELAGGEPAVQANLALYYIRNTQLPKAEELLKKAKEAAPENAEIAMLEGLLLDKQGKLGEGIAAYQRAVSKNPRLVKALYAIYDLANRQNGADKATVQKEALEKILTVRPNNIKARVFLAELLATAGDRAGLQEQLTALESAQSGWPAEARAKLAETKAKAATGEPRALFFETRRIENLLGSSVTYQSSQRELETPKVAGEPLQRFLKLVNPPATPAAPDTGLSYTLTPALAAPWTLTVDLDETSKPVRISGTDPSQTSAVAFDFDDIKGSFEGGVAKEKNVFRMEVAAVGSQGLRLYSVDTSGALTDITASAKLPPAIQNAAYTGVWAVDIEADGDLDLVLSPPTGHPIVLQNNGDHTFTVAPSKFDGVACPLRSLVWADFDLDGDNDLVFADARGQMVYYANERSGAFVKKDGPSGTNTVAMVAAEATGDTRLDVVALDGTKGTLTAFSIQEDGTWTSKPVGDSGLAGAATGLLAADLDNNGAVDYVVSGKDKSVVLLSGGPSIPVAQAVDAAVDLNGDGILDLAGPTSTALGASKQKYGSFTVTLKAIVSADPADKINTFCLGGALEVRAGLLYQKVPLTGPKMHLGLGSYEKPDVLRIDWPNGRGQSETSEDLKAGQPLVADQRLGGSCPFLFTWDGEKFVFVTDCIWRSPLGLKINAQATAGSTQTEDWVKVRGDQLKPKDGFYDLAVTAELQETHFFDHLSLLVVDHPENSDIFIDERFHPVQMPLLKVIPTGTVQPLAEAKGWKGQDLTDVLAERDGRYVDDFGRGKYQGVTSDHWLEVALPESAPRGKPLYLIAHGWLHPTNTSINVAMGQDKSQGPPQGLSLWVPDSKGNWSKRRDSQGFPAGKLKTMVFRVDDLFAPGAPRRVRLRTNLEVYWDQITWAETRPDSILKTQRLSLATAELRYRGFSEVRAADASSPELPLSYEQLAGTAPRWRDLVGFVTRFGDVRPLLTGVDDRYAILNAGDELRLRFKAPAPPPAGWKRDFVVISDGWEKDGNLNTTFGKTVAPYPLHRIKDYTVPPTTLDKDAAYQAHRADFEQYHTRWIDTHAYENALKAP